MALPLLPVVVGVRMVEWSCGAGIGSVGGPGVAGVPQLSGDPSTLRPAGVVSVAANAPPPPLLAAMAPLRLRLRAQSQSAKNTGLSWPSVNFTTNPVSVAHSTCSKHARTHGWAGKGQMETPQ